MATVVYIKERTQSKTSMKRVTDYVSQDKKTAYTVDGNVIKLISGKDCCAESAYREFMNTKMKHGKTNGTYFYQCVQSFSPEENVLPETAHEIGKKLAEYFKDFEVLIATHVDADHTHNHLVRPDRAFC